MVEKSQSNLDSKVDLKQLLDEDSETGIDPQINDDGEYELNESYREELLSRIEVLPAEEQLELANNIAERIRDQVAALEEPQKDKNPQIDSEKRKRSKGLKKIKMLAAIIPLVLAGAFAGIKTAEHQSHQQKEEKDKVAEARFQQEQQARRAVLESKGMSEIEANDLLNILFGQPGDDVLKDLSVIPRARAIYDLIKDGATYQDALAQYYQNHPDALPVHFGDDRSHQQKLLEKGASAEVVEKILEDYHSHSGEENFDILRFEFADAILGKVRDKFTHGKSWEIIVEEVTFELSISNSADKEKIIEIAIEYAPGLRQNYNFMNR